MALVCESTSSHNKRAKLHSEHISCWGKVLERVCDLFVSPFCLISCPFVFQQQSADARVMSRVRAFYYAYARSEECWRINKYYSLSLARSLASTGYKLWLIFQLWFILQINKSKVGRRWRRRRRRRNFHGFYFHPWTVLYAACEQHEKLTFFGS